MVHGDKYRARGVQSHLYPWVSGYLITMKQEIYMVWITGFKLAGYWIVIPVNYKLNNDYPILDN